MGVPEKVLVGMGENLSLLKSMGIGFYPPLGCVGKCGDLWRRPRCAAARCKILPPLLLLLLLLLHLHLLPPPPPPPARRHVHQEEHQEAAAATASAAPSSPVPQPAGVTSVGPGPHNRCPRYVTIFVTFCDTVRMITGALLVIVTQLWIF